VERYDLNQVRHTLPAQRRAAAVSASS
jgi:hypothetical protein